MKGLTRNYEFISTLSRYQNELGWGNYANDHEDANGQFESNFEYDDALATADRAIFFRYMVHAMAQERGYLATFMPKPFSNLTGNGGHLHISLWDPDRRAQPVRGRDRPARARAVAARLPVPRRRLDHAEGVLAIGAPTVNSYKRIGVGAPTSGATWAPAYATYGMNNRTQAIRIPAPGRIEIRGDRRRRQPVPRRRRRSSAPASTASSAASTPASRTPENLYDLSLAEVEQRGIKMLPATLLDAVRHLKGDACCRTGSARASARATSTTSARRRPTSSTSTTRTSPTGSARRYLTLFYAPLRGTLEDRLDDWNAAWEAACRLSQR